MKKVLFLSAAVALLAMPAAAFDIQLGAVGVIGGAGVSGVTGLTSDYSETDAKVKTLRSGNNVTSEGLSEGYAQSDSTFQGDHGSIGIGPVGIGGYAMSGSTDVESGHRSYAGVQSAGNGNGSSSAGGSSAAGGLSAGVGGSLNIGGVGLIAGGQINP